MHTIEQYQAGEREQLIVQSMTHAEAERISTRITLRLDTIADNYSAVLPLIREAIERKAHAALGYVSAGAYISDRFGDALAKLPANMRRVVVHELSDAGLSTRAIAPVVGVSKSQVAVDIEVSSSGHLPDDDTREETATPVPEPLDPPMVVDEATGEILDDEPGQVIVSEHTETVKTKTVTGLDGKTYQKPTPTEPRRRPLTDQSRTAGWDLTKAMERIGRIRADDRFGRNKDEVATHLRSHLQNAIEVCQDLLDELNS